MGYVPDWSRKDMKKSGAKAGSNKSPVNKGNPFLPPTSPLNSPKLEHRMQGPLKLADGGPVDYSNYAAEDTRGKPVSEGSFWERLKAGNKDDIGSPAYAQWGEGRKIAERVKASGDDYERAIPGAASSSNLSSDTDTRRDENGLPTSLIGAGESRPPKTEYGPHWEVKSGGSGRKGSKASKLSTATGVVEASPWRIPATPSPEADVNTNPNESKGAEVKKSTETAQNVVPSEAPKKVEASKKEEAPKKHPRTGKEYGFDTMKKDAEERAAFREKVLAEAKKKAGG